MDVAAEVVGGMVEDENPTVICGSADVVVDMDWVLVVESRAIVVVVSVAVEYELVVSNEVVAWVTSGSEVVVSGAV